MEVAKMKRRVLACLLVPLTCSAYDCRMRYTLSCATPLGLCLPPLYQGGGVALSYIHPDPLPRTCLAGRDIALRCPRPRPSGRNQSGRTCMSTHTLRPS